MSLYTGASLDQFSRLRHGPEQGAQAGGHQGKADKNVEVALRVPQSC